MFTWTLIAILCAGLLLLLWKLTRARAAHPYVEEVSVDPSAVGPPPKKPLYVDNNVRFTVYQPKAVAPGRWYKLLAFAHLSERRPEAVPDSPDPVKAVKREAEQILKKRIDDYEKAALPSMHPVPHEGELVFAPHVEGIIFNPPAQPLMWLRDVHHVEFQMTAGKDYDGRQLRGSLSIFHGPVMLADIPLVINVDGNLPPPEETAYEPVSARPYRKIFPSYSRHDLKIVEEFEHYAAAVGDKYLRDVCTLRSGEAWEERLCQLIEEAEVFQLFWSTNSMRSKFVRQEWEHALKLNRPNFIRPTFWEDPMPRDDDLPPSELASLHFHKISVGAARARRRQRPSSATAMKVLPLLLVGGLLLGVLWSAPLWRSAGSGRFPEPEALPQDVQPSPTGTQPAAPAVEDEKLGQDVLTHLRFLHMDKRGAVMPEGIEVEVDTRTVKLFDGGGNVRGSINVGASQGVVTLYGFVGDAAQRTAVEACAKKVAGVREVRNQLSLSGEQRQGGANQRR